MQVLYERHGKHSLERLTRQFFQASADAEVNQLAHSVVTFDDFYRRFAKPWPKVSCTHTCTRASHQSRRAAPLPAPAVYPLSPRDATSAANGHSNLALPQP